MIHSDSILKNMGIFLSSFRLIVDIIKAFHLKLFCKFKWRRNSNLLGLVTHEWKRAVESSFAF